MGLVELRNDADMAKIQLYDSTRRCLSKVVSLAQGLSSIVVYDESSKKVYLNNEDGLQSQRIPLNSYYLDGMSAALEFATNLKSAGGWTSEVAEEQIKHDAPTTQETSGTKDWRERFDFEGWKRRAEAIGNDLTILDGFSNQKPKLCYYRKASPTKSPFVKANYCPEVRYQKLRGGVSAQFVFATNLVVALDGLCRLIENDEKIYAKWVEKGRPKTYEEVIYAEGAV